MKPLMVAIGPTVDALVRICRQDIPAIREENDVTERIRKLKKSLIIEDGEKLLFMRLKHKGEDRP